MNGLKSIGYKMKFRVFVVLLLASVAVSDTRQNRFEAGLLKVIEKCKSGDTSSLPVGFPSLSNFVVPPITSQRRGFTMSIGELTIDGLQDLMVTGLSTYPAYNMISVELFVPRMVIHSDWYHLQTGLDLGVLDLTIPLVDDEGQFTCYADNVNIRADVQFGASGSNTVITDLNLKYTGDIQVNLSGSDGIVNDIANAKISQMMRDRRAIGRMETLVKERASRYLQGHTPDEFIRIISNI